MMCGVALVERMTNLFLIAIIGTVVPTSLLYHCPLPYAKGGGCSSCRKRQKAV